MDKYEYAIKTEKLKKLVEARDWKAAEKVADMIDWRREKNLRMLAVAASVYEEAGRYQDAKDILMLSYERAPVGRRLLYKLTEISVKERNFKDAAMFYKEYVEVAPNDLGKYILRYRIAAGRGEPLEDQIAMLEAYKEREFDERWAYELAKLYHKAGRGEDCVRLCDEIILWFSFGPYVEKAMELKTIYEPLTPSQVEKAENQDKYEEKMRQVAQEMEGKYEPVSPGQALELGQDSLDIPLEEGKEDKTENLIPDAPVPEKIEKPLEVLSGEKELAESVAEIMSGAETEEEKEDKEKEKELLLEGEPSQLTMVFEEGEPTFTEEEMEPVFLSQKGEDKLWQTEEEQGEPVNEQEEKEPSPQDGEEARPELQEPAVPETEKMTEAEEIAEAEEVPEEKQEDISFEEVEKLLAEMDVLKEAKQETVVVKLLGADTEKEGLQKAAAYIKEQRKEAGLAKGRAAKADAQKLNQVGLLASLEKLSGADLVIAHGLSLSDSMLKELEAVRKRQDLSMYIVVIDEPEKIEALEKRMNGKREIAEPMPKPEKETISEASFHFAVPKEEPEEKRQEFMEWIRKYVEEIECVMEEKSWDAVYGYAKNCQEQKIPLTEQLAVDLVESAADEAEKKNRHRLFEKKYDKRGYLILKEQHFIQEGH